MLSRPLCLILAGALLLAAAPAADAKKKKARSSATYMVTVKASMKERWNFRDYLSYDCLDGMCTREELGSGTASANFSTRTPLELFALRGPKGRPPTLNLGSDGFAMSGNWLRGGDLSMTYSGAWDAANPDRVSPTTDCGRKSTRFFGSIGWSYEQAHNLALQLEGEPLRADCPDGPPTTIEWEGGESPSLSDALGYVGPDKLLRAKQFTVRGSRSWKGTVPPMNRTDPLDTRIINGEKTVTWQWEATFRMKGAKKKKQRRG